MAAGNVTPQSWARSLLSTLGAPTTAQNMQAVVGWEHAEGGHWNNSATYNPLNTTQPAPGAGNTGSQGNIKQYTSWQQGLNATVQTLRNGYYPTILAALHAGNNPQAVASAIGSSQWGTSGTLVSQTIRAAAGQIGGGGSLVAGGSSPSLSSTPGMKTGIGTTKTFNGPGYAAASAKAIAGAYLKNASDPYNIPLPKTGLPTGGLSTGITQAQVQAPLANTGLLNAAQPNPANFYHVAHNALQKLAGPQTQLNVHPQAVGQYQGYVNPIPHATVGRTDMGVDLNLPVGAPVRAIGDSRVVNIYPNWYAGQPYVLLQLLNGPQKGRYYYVAEQIAPHVHAGQVLRTGQAIGTYASSGTGIEMGWGTSNESTLAQATTGYSEGEVTHAGQSFRDFLQSLGA